MIAVRESVRQKRSDVSTTARGEFRTAERDSFYSRLKAVLMGSGFAVAVEAVAASRASPARQEAPFIVRKESRVGVLARSA